MTEQTRDIVVIAASAGGVEALRELVQLLPVDLPAAVMIVLHVPASGGSVLPAILSRVGGMPARHAEDGEEIVRGQIYVAPPDQHLLVHDGRLRLARGPRENGHRPAADPLFRSAAHWHGPRVIGVVLSGSLDDGTAGLVSIVRHHGLAMVQDPAEATYAGMPRSALAHVPDAIVGTVAELGAQLSKRVLEPVGRAQPAPYDQEVAMAELDLTALEAPERTGVPAGYSCPDCNGTLFDVSEEGVVRFRCRVGHAWSAESLVASQSEELEMALWTALRSLEEKAALCRRLEIPAYSRNTSRGDAYADAAIEAERASRVIRELLLHRAGDSPAVPVESAS